MRAKRELEHLQEYSKQSLNLVILVKLEKKLIFNNSQTHLPIFWHLEKNHLHVCKVKSAYSRANLEVEGHGEEKKVEQGSVCKCTREKYNIKVVSVI